MADPFFSNLGPPQDSEFDGQEFDISNLSLNKTGESAAAEELTINGSPPDLKSMSMDELRQLKQKLRQVVTVTAPVASRSVYKRENKNRPRELSAKHREPKNKSKEIERRDPRFEETSGDFDEDKFQKRYSFLNEMREKERRQLAKLVRREKDPEKKESLVKLKQRIDNQYVSQCQRENEKRVVVDLKKEEKEKTGKKYVRDSDVKAALIVQKFQQLKKSGKLSRYLEKKRKKNAAKDRRKIE